MITYDEVLNLNYYKKTTYSGWAGGMRFKIQREVPENENDEALEPIFHVWIWPGPYIFDKTPAEKKYTAQFPFSEEGKKQAVDWLNEQYHIHLDEWPARKTDEH